MVGRLWGRLRGGGRAERARLLLAEGLARRRAGDYEAAVRLYGEALAHLEPSADREPALTAALYLARGIACRAARRPEQMLADYTAALRWLHGTPAAGYDACALRACGRMRTGHLAGAEADFLRFCRLYRHGAPGLLPDADYDHDRAIADCSRALEWQPGLAAAALCRAWLRALQGDPVGAARDAGTGLHLLPESEDPALRDQFRALYGAALEAGGAARLNRRAWMAPGWDYAAVQSEGGGDTRLDFRRAGGDEAMLDGRPVWAVREALADEGWAYMASEYSRAGAETHYYRAAGEKGRE